MIVEADDRYQVNLADYKVMQCVVDFAFSLDLEHDSQKVMIRIEGPFTLSKDGQTYELSAEDRPGDLGPALELSRTSIRSAVVQKSGELELNFDDGTALLVRGDPNYEAWTLTVTGGPIVISGPGGKLTFFNAPANPV
jgi:hypothetical protein